MRDGYLQLVVNALWAAGAEAVSINGQRLGPTTAIRFAGEAVLVDFRPVTNPYEISAIGNPDALQREFLENSEVKVLAGVSASTTSGSTGPEGRAALPAATHPNSGAPAPLRRAGRIRKRPDAGG